MKGQVRVGVRLGFRLSQGFNEKKFPLNVPDS